MALARCNSQTPFSSSSPNADSLADTPPVAIIDFGELGVSYSEPNSKL